MKGCEGGDDMMAMMSKMMEGCEPGMMTEMMSHCLGMMLQKMPQEKRMEFVLKMVVILKEQGSSGMSDEEKKTFLGKVVETVKA
jgi:hypothetical protein